jgi:hypothetical protein
VLKLVKVKSPGQSRRQSVEDLLSQADDSLDGGSSVIIVEPTVPSFGKRNSLGGATTVDNTYCIQHQQIITPTGRKSLHTSSSSKRNSLALLTNTDIGTSCNETSLLPCTNFDDYLFERCSAADFVLTSAATALKKSNLANANSSGVGSARSILDTSFKTLVNDIWENKQPASGIIEQFELSNQQNNNAYVEWSDRNAIAQNKTASSLLFALHTPLSSSSTPTPNLALLARNTNLALSHNTNTNVVDDMNEHDDENDYDDAHALLTSSYANLNANKEFINSVEPKLNKLLLKTDLLDAQGRKDHEENSQQSDEDDEQSTRREQTEKEEEGDYESIEKQKHKHECDDYTNVSESGYKSSDYLTLKSFKSLVSSSLITTNERISSQNFDLLMREQDDEQDQEEPLKQLVVEEEEKCERDEHERSSISTTSTDNDANKKKSEMSDTTTPNSAASLESMQRFERPSKQEMLQHKLEIREEHESRETSMHEQRLEPAREECQTEQAVEPEQQIKVVYEDSDEQLLSKLRDNMTKMRQQQQQQSHVMLDDVTDISEDEQNIFSSSLTSKQQFTSLMRDEEKKKMKKVEASSSSSTASSSGSSSGEERRSRQVPLRRESFEMAQKDKNKRLNVSSSPLVSKVSDELAHNKRLLCEIKPSVTNYDSTEDQKQVKVDGDYTQTTLRRLNESVSSQSEQSDSNDSSILRHNYELLRKKSLEQSSASTANSIRSKKSEEYDEEEDDEQPNFTSNLVKCLSKPALNLEPDVCPLSPISNGSSSIASTPLHNQRPAKIKVVKKNRLSKLAAPSVATAEINNRLRSISPGLLRRDIVETIETTTSMSFIMNKNVNLIVEEKRVPPATSESPITVNKLTKSQTNLAASSRPDHPLYEHMKSTPIPITVQTRSKSEPKLNDSANLSFSSNNSYVQTPIYIQGNYANASSSTSNYSNQSSFQADYQRVQPQPAENTQRARNYNLRRPLYNHEMRNVINNNSNNRSRITFHKYDSNEIIAVVNVPGAKSDVHTIEAINRNAQQAPIQQHLQEHFKQHLQHCREQNLSKSESDLMSRRVSRVQSEHKNRTTDRWSAWPEYAVEQETDCSMVSSPGHEDQSPTWVRTIRSSSSGPQLKASEIAFEIEIEREEDNNAVQRTPRKTGPLIQTPGVSLDSRKLSHPAAHYLHHAHTHSQNVMMAEHEAAFATRMSSGYFSGDDFKFCSPDYYYNYLLNNSGHASQHQQSPTISSSSNQSNNGGNQFNISKFLNNRRSARLASNGHQTYDAIDEFDRLYKSIGFDEDDLLVNNVASSSMYGRFDEFDAGNQSGTSMMTEDVTIMDRAHFRPINSCARRQVRPDAIKDDMARRRCLVNIPIERDSSLNKSISSINRHSSSFVSDYDTLRKRSNSMSSLNPNESFINPLILPSPTCADYLRNKTRENALINVVMNPSRTTHNDVELSQILYDDMAFRQLRKDSEASKLAQIKSTVKTSNMMTMSRPSTRLHQAHNQTFSSQMPTYYTQQTKSYFDLSTTTYGHANMTSCTTSSSSTTTNTTNNKTVKMLKQKDRLKENRLSTNQVYTNR